MGLHLAIYWIILTFILVGICAFVSKKFGYEYLIGIFAASIVIVNILNSKMVEVWGLTFPAGTILFASMFLMTDILSEFFGKQAAKRAVWAGFLANIFFLLSLSVALIFPAASFWQNQDAFAAILGSTPRIILASIMAYIIGQLHDIWAFHFWKRITKSKYLWVRSCLSTIPSQFIDTLIFFSIAFYGVMPLIPLMVSAFAIKAVIAILDTPMMYLTRWYFKRGTPA